MMNCSQVQDLRFAFLDGEIDPAVQAGVESHLRECPDCADRYAAERAFLDRIAGAGRESAPPGLRDRIERMLAEAETGEFADRPGETGEASVVPLHSRRRLWTLVVPLAAAVIAFVLIARPGGDRTAAFAAEGFAADHAHHAASEPSIAPFRPGAEVPSVPEVGEGRLAGLSRCVIDGRAYAHYVLAVGESRVSVYLPLDAPMSLDRDVAVAREGATVLAVDEELGPGGGVLVSETLTAEDLGALLSDA